MRVGNSSGKRTNWDNKNNNWQHCWNSPSFPPPSLAAIQHRVVTLCCPRNVCTAINGTSAASRKHLNCDCQRQRESGRSFKTRQGINFLTNFTKLVRLTAGKQFVYCSCFSLAVHVALMSHFFSFCCSNVCRLIPTPPFPQIPCYPHTSAPMPAMFTPTYSLTSPC